MSAATQERVEGVGAMIERHQREVEAVVTDLRKRHDEERKGLSRRLETMRQEHAQQVVDDLLRAAFEDARGGMNPATSARVSLTGVGAYNVGDQIQKALKKASDNAKHGTTPAAIIGIPGSMMRGEPALKRVILVADVSEILEPEKR